MQSVDKRILVYQFSILFTAGSCLSIPDKCDWTFQGHIYLPIKFINMHSTAEPIPKQESCQVNSIVKSMLDVAMLKN